MPSPTSSTCPTSRVSTFRSNSEICLLMTLRISLALVAMADALVEQESAEGLEPGADGGVDHPVADLDDEAAEEVRVHSDVQDGLFAEHVGQGLGQGTALGVGQVGRGGHLHLHASGPFVENLP